MATRRGFMVGLLAASILPKPTWADVGDPRYLAAARVDDNKYQLFGLGENGRIVFELPLPDRGHAAAAHPSRPQAVAFARRPGTFALVIDCLNRNITAQLNAPAGRHFYGHGIYSLDGSLLFTTENDYEAGQGRVGVWDVENGYQRHADFSSGGVGPHEILRLPNTDVLVIANGGIDTHPTSGRAKLNIPDMSPNLTFLDYSGNLIDQMSLDKELRLNSIRHLSVRDDGLIAFAMQWQGAFNTKAPLLGLYQPRKEPLLLRSPAKQHAQMRGYGASIAFTGDGKSVAISSSRGGQVQIFNVTDANYSSSYYLSDVSGLSGNSNGFAITSGNGKFVSLLGNKPVAKIQHNKNWDNHLVRIPRPAN